MHEVLVEKAKQFRKPTRLKQVFGRFEGQGLVVSDGDLWVRQRRLVQPAFPLSQMEAYAAPIAALVGQMLGRWEDHSTIDVAAEMRRLTLRIVARTLFSSSVDETVDQLGTAVDVIQAWSMQEMNRVMPWPKWLPLFGRPRVRAAFNFVDVLVRRIIAERRASQTSDRDLLGQLLAAVDTEGNGRGMSDRHWSAC